MLKFSKDHLDTNPFSIVITLHQVKKYKERSLADPEKNHNYAGNGLFEVPGQY